MGKHSIAEAQRKLPELIDRARAGEPVTIVREDGEPIADLMPRARDIAEPETPAGPNAADDDPMGLKWLAERRKRFPDPSIDLTELVSRMRDEDWR